MQLATIDNGGDPRAGNPHQLLELSFRAGLGGSRPSTAAFTSLRATSVPVWPSRARHTSPVLLPPMRFDRLEARLWCVGMDSSRCGHPLWHRSPGDRNSRPRGTLTYRLGQVFIRYLR